MWLLPGMCSHVPGQIRLSTCLVLALLARVRPLLAMHAHVRIEMVWLRRSVPALCAYIRLLTCVGADMSGEGAAQKESTAAVRADERQLFFVVSKPDVLLKKRPPPESFVTDIACIRFLDPGMGLHVPIQIMFLFEGLVTHVASMQPVLGVSGHVFLQIVLSCE